MRLLKRAFLKSKVVHNDLEPESLQSLGENIDQIAV